MPPDSPIDDLFSLLDRSSSLPYIGEAVSQLEHALQAAELAARAGSSDAIIAAALLHDIGHICQRDAEPMAGLGAKHHERIGAEHLASLGFGPGVTALVASHVSAKRWLVARRPEYAATLSDASRQTLVYQGGPMTEDEATRFETEPTFRDALRLRAWDEQAKVVGWSGPSLESYRALLGRLLAGARA